MYYLTRGVIELGKISPIKRLRAEDFPGSDPKLLSVLSQTLELFATTLDGYVNFENISGQIYERQDIVKDTGEITASNPLRLAYKKKYTPIAVMCAGVWVKNSDSKAAKLGYNITLEWDFDSSNRQIVIKGVNGLPVTSSKYTSNFQITVIAFAR